MFRYIAFITPEEANKHIGVGRGHTFQTYPDGTPNELLVPWPQQFDSVNHARNALNKLGITPTTTVQIDMPVRVVKFHVVYRDNEGNVHTSQGYDTERLAGHAADELAKYNTIIKILPIELKL